MGGILFTTVVPETEIKMENRKKAIGIMGGTFDPIHYGHLVTAEAVRAEYGLERVFFVPSGHPPHKEDQKVTYAEQRFLMTFLAIAGNYYFEVSRMEIERPGKSYAYDTITAFRKLFPDYRIYFITGADAVKEILTWHRFDELLDLCSFVGATRPGYCLEDMLKGDEQLVAPDYMDKITVIEVPAMAISSSEIRKRVREGKPIKYLLPEDVEQYIYKHGIYMTEEN